jgi:hypothetical protein
MLHIVFLSYTFEEKLKGNELSTFKQILVASLTTHKVVRETAMSFLK